MATPPPPPPPPLILSNNPPPLPHPSRFHALLVHSHTHGQANVEVMTVWFALAYECPTVCFTTGVDIVGAMILTAFVRPVTWFIWPALPDGSDPGGSTSGPVSPPPLTLAKLCESTSARQVWVEI